MCYSLDFLRKAPTKNGRPGRYLKSYRKTKREQKRDHDSSFQKETNTPRGNSEGPESDDSDGKKRPEIPKSPSYARKPRNCSLCFIRYAVSRKAKSRRGFDSMAVISSTVHHQTHKT